MMKSEGQDRHLPPGYAGREPKSIRTQRLRKKGISRRKERKAG